MAIRKSEPPRKVELVSLIDVVFLLLVFFIITTSFLRGTGGGEADQVVDNVSIPDTQSHDFNVLKAGLILYPYSEDGRSDIEYYLFTPKANWNVLSRILNQMGPLPYMRQNRAVFDRIGAGSYNIHVLPNQLFSCLRGVDVMAIRAADSVPWAEVTKAYNICKNANPGMKIIFMIESRSNLFKNIRRSQHQLIITKCG